MRTYTVLILTDHSTHSAHNSFYDLANELRRSPRVSAVAVASRGLPQNRSFFQGIAMRSLSVTWCRSDITYHQHGERFAQSLVEVDLHSFDLILLRVPQPLSDQFLRMLSITAPNASMINDPLGIIHCSDKSFLLEFPELCPPMRLCHSLAEINHFAATQEVVLKPLREYGGKGLLKISGGIIHDGSKAWDKDAYLSSLEEQIKAEGVLAMKFLKGVKHGDKRLIVVGGDILAASLRRPPKGSWLCNVSQGGTSVKATADKREESIVAAIAPALKARGILICGVDTLQGDDGQRVLSEINVVSVGGLKQAAQQTGLPIVEQTISKMLNYADAHAN